MKKIFILLIVLAFASTSFAAWQEDEVVLAKDHADTFNVPLSNNVKADNEATSIGFTAATHNTNGKKQVLTTNNAPLVYWTWCSDKNTKCGTSHGDLSLTAGETLSGWTEL